MPANFASDVRHHLDELQRRGVVISAFRETPESPIRALPRFIVSTAWGSLLMIEALYLDATVQAHASTLEASLLSAMIAQRPRPLVPSAALDFLRHSHAMILVKARCQTGETMVCAASGDMRRLAFNLELYPCIVNKEESPDALLDVRVLGTGSEWSLLSAIAPEIARRPWREDWLVQRCVMDAHLDLARIAPVLDRAFDAGGGLDAVWRMLYAMREHKDLFGDPYEVLQYMPKAA